MSTELKLPVSLLGPTATRSEPPTASIDQRSAMVPSTSPEATYVASVPSRAKAKSGVVPPVPAKPIGRQSMQSTQPHWGSLGAAR